VFKIRKIQGDSRDLGQIKMKVLGSGGQELAIGAKAETAGAIVDESSTKKKGDLRITSKFNSHAKSRALWIVNFENPRSRKYNLTLADTSVSKIDTIVLKDVNLSIGQSYIKELELTLDKKTYILSEGISY
jgi:hypothetical protein